MKTALVIGATGLTGRSLLQLLLASDRYSQVNVMVRRDAGLVHPKLQQHIINFDELGQCHKLIQGGDLFNCMGSTIKKAGSKESFERIDLHIPLEIAKVAYANGTQQLISIASIMASSSSSSHYLKTKGQLEDAFKAIGFKFFASLQPSLLVGDRQEFRLAEKLIEVVMIPLNHLLVRVLRNYRTTSAEVLAKAMYNIAQMGESGVRIIQSKEIPQLAAIETK